ncbi:MAG: ABC transporter permease [Gemmatimonadetes bacterium]|nr:ABC transporter permease [Gemmatimonadota bacterium]
MSSRLASVGRRRTAEDLASVAGPRSPEKAAAPTPVSVIEPSTGWASLALGELWAYRDLLYFLVWREIKVRYAQSVMGVGWAVIQPVFSMLVFTVVFGNLVGVSSDGVPYALFSFVALVPWTYFQNALTGGIDSLVIMSSMLTKVYFPRLIIPLTPVLARLLDFGIALVLLMALMAWFKAAPTAGVVMVPVLVILMVLSAAGLGFWLTALAVQYRDVKYAASFGIQLLMYAAPVVYPVSLVPERFQTLYALNPMVGVIEGFRSAMLGARPMPWNLIGIGAVSAIVVALGGAFYFRRVERVFADVV